MDVDLYRREDVLEDLEHATRDHTGRRAVVEWVCDCGCNIAFFFQRTDQGLALARQAMPRGEPLAIIVFETRDEVQRCVAATAANIRAAGAGVNVDALRAQIEARAASFEKAVWTVWSES